MASRLKVLHLGPISDGKQLFDEHYKSLGSLQCLFCQFVPTQVPHKLKHLFVVSKKEVLDLCTLPKSMKNLGARVDHVEGSCEGLPNLRSLYLDTDTKVCGSVMKSFTACGVKRLFLRQYNLPFQIFAHLPQSMRSISCHDCDCFLDKKDFSLLSKLKHLKSVFLGLVVIDYQGKGSIFDCFKDSRIAFIDVAFAEAPKKENDMVYPYYMFNTKDIAAVLNMKHLEKIAFRIDVKEVLWRLIVLLVLVQKEGFVALIPTDFDSMTHEPLTIQSNEIRFFENDDCGSIRKKMEYCGCHYGCRYCGK